MNLPGFRLHTLKGELKGHWAVWVSENWRVTVSSTATHMTWIISIITRKCVHANA